MRQYYGPWLDEKGKAAVEAGYESAARKAWRCGPSFSGTTRTRSSNARPNPPWTPSLSRRTSSSRRARRNCARIWRTIKPAGPERPGRAFTSASVSFYAGRQASDVLPPLLPQLTDAVSRQNDLPLGYVQSALKLIDKLEGLILEQNKIESAPATGPPATLTMADLSILLSPAHAEDHQAPLMRCRQPSPGLLE